MDAEAFDRIMLEAINEEVMAREFYTSAAKKIKDKNVRAIFEELAQDEERHRVKLEEFRFNPIARVAFERVSGDYHVAESEDRPQLSFDMSPKDAFQLAMKKEQEAMEAYEYLAAQCTKIEFKNLYRQLAGMEKAHKTKLENLFINAAYPEDWGE
jgi:rubrerythrin